eukprot:3940998-Rhodomonas_salina.8
MWLGNVAHGRFSRLVLPEGKRDGTGLLSLTPTNLAEMFETETLRNARRCASPVGLATAERGGGVVESDGPRQRGVASFFVLGLESARSGADVADAAARKLGRLFYRAVQVSSPRSLQPRRAREARLRDQGQARPGSAPVAATRCDGQREGQSEIEGESGWGTDTGKGGGREREREREREVVLRAHTASNLRFHTPLPRVGN